MVFEGRGCTLIKCVWCLGSWLKERFWVDDGGRREGNGDIGWVILNIER